MVMFVLNLLYQRFGAILMSRHRFMKLFYLKNQAFSTVMLVGKLSYLFNVSDYSTEEWKIDLEELKRKIPEISWNASPYAVDINSFSLDDFYFATI